ncbi:MULTISPECIES: adenylosuccinate lyase [Aerococcus]|uniref:adenylosuccinate lyase n=1 Tax=Aerococcus TaxID=1375 RepID=UPI0018A7746E|nr:MULTISPECIES: adenylosuccinate lyase [Aerococcus]MCY3036002.1 adenylosuccinate lyase [Aerococcus sp. Group 2]MCY3039098.1 adenylosuccinate lyase [Aerococcus sp. Group 2]MCY3040671.1 adenylosuccinate lyase [Aerococcus sp. Group 2]MCY3042665.1 adenylosuccinate lyase [Aerococcus sp. Group 2]MDK6520114.1 adenylosuccinate lyase [Aerococcus urinae]
MLERYTLPEMGAIWSLENHYQAWLEVEILAVEAWSELGVIPQADAQAIRQNARFDVDRISEIEAQTRHDVVAFTRCLSESLGAEKKWVHYGLTSTDVVDTAQAYQLKQANRLIKKDLDQLLEILKEKALTYKDTVCMGRTHGVHAEPTTFGLKMARFYAEIKRNIERFNHAARGVEAGKISGAVGTYANVPTDIEAYVCDHLGIRQQDISTQVLPRDLHAEYIASLALIATSVENMATEIRHLQRSEVHEVEESFAKGQKGSSAMPHKRNPISSENVTGLARVCRGHVVTAYENVSLWHERDISHSSAERIILADTTILVDYILNRFSKVLKNLKVFPEKMLANMQATHGLIYSQRLLLKLVDAGLSREAAYDLVQPLTAKSWDQGQDFRSLVEGCPEITDHLSPEAIDDAFDYHYHLRRVDEIYKRLGLISAE